MITLLLSNQKLFKLIKHLQYFIVKYKRNVVTFPKFACGTLLRKINADLI